MNDDLHLLVYTFHAVSQAEAARTALATIDTQLGGSRPGQLALVQKSTDGQISLRETGDSREELSNIVASVAGGITWFVYSFVGLFGPPPAIFADHLADSAVHRLVRDSGFPDQALFEIGEELDAGSAAVIALVSTSERLPFVSELERLGGRLWEHQLPASVVAELRSSDPQT